MFSEHVFECIQHHTWWVIHSPPLPGRPWGGYHTVYIYIFFFSAIKCPYRGGASLYIYIYWCKTYIYIYWDRLFYIHCIEQIVWYMYLFGLSKNLFCGIGHLRWTLEVDDGLLLQARCFQVARWEVSRTGPWRTPLLNVLRHKRSTNRLIGCARPLSHGKIWEGQKPMCLGLPWRSFLSRYSKHAVQRRQYFLHTYIYICIDIQF